MSTTLEVGKKLAEFCKQGKHLEAIEALYAPNIVSVEAMAGPDHSARSEGIAAIKGKNKWWVENHTVHGSEVMGPFPNGDRFICHFKYDVTPKAGPMAGKRFTMDEGALYTVKDGKIVHEEFFYNMG